MKTTAVVLSTALLLGQGMSATSHGQTDKPKPPEPAERTLTLKMGETERRYLVHVPPGYESKKPVAVVVMIHGAGGTGKWTVDETGWGDKADKEGFLLVCPEGTPIDPSQPPAFRTNPQLWNDGSGRGFIGRQNVDDPAFFNALFDDLATRFAVDRQRIYVTGFSNGAGMTFRLGAELSQRIAAIAPVASHCWVKDPKPVRAVPTFYLIGTKDPLVPLEGGDVKSPWGGRVEKKPPVRDTLAKWAGALGCPTEPKVLSDKEGVKAVVYGPGKNDAELVVYTVEGLGHHWPGGKGQLPQILAGKPSDKLKANDVIWEFFRNHPKR